MVVWFITYIWLYHLSLTSVCIIRQHTSGHHAISGHSIWTHTSICIIRSLFLGILFDHILPVILLYHILLLVLFDHTLMIVSFNTWFSCIIDHIIRLHYLLTYVWSCYCFTLVASLTDWLTDWLIDRLIDWLTELLITHFGCTIHRLFLFHYSFQSYQQFA
jgi:hypothetical protein